MRTRGWAGACLALTAVLACASAPERRGDATPDRTDDPEFEAARKAARPEFESQAEALAAGVYEPFVHPDSMAAGRASVPDEPAGRAIPTTPRDRGDPSTGELLGTLGSDVQYNQGVEANLPPRVAVPTSGRGVWTLQMGAFGSETGALVRVRELQQRFPDLPAWRVMGQDGLVRVFLGRFQDEAAGEPARERVRSAGYPDAWVVRAP